ncbi:uncharacterized protein LOC117948966 [Etheostoma cragini]|uniref:uncharacterized protein LOC117948966 n=1 Tax=Etheostoma cragini TaxID=417921 RepID=UPI00155E17D3|nr:uncharacterized protein LOC117948966 [Etheostoma cragini]
MATLVLDNGAYTAKIGYSQEKWGVSCDVVCCRAILYELGLQGKLTTDQLAKKWDNLKRRYKELKFPPRGAETNPSSWPWFYRMNDAMEGRLAGAAPVLTPIVEDEDEDCEPLSPTPKKRARRSRGGMSEFLTESEMDLLVENEDKNASAALGELQRMAEFTYKLTEEDIKRLIELRASNESLFTGRRNTAKPAWRGIVKGMGLTGKITPDQVAKKWDNLKTKFKDLKFPPRGMESQTNPASWPWFQLMSEALEGRLAGKAPRVTPVWSSEEDGVFGSSPPPDRDCLMAERGSVSELESMVGGGDAAETDGSVTYIDASGEECSTPSDLSYKMTDQDTRRLIKLRAANETLFTGRRNAAKAAWKAILKELGLQGKVSTHQMAKKWDNLKRRYKDLKYPPVGMETVADSSSSWPWFHLMNEAMEGRLASSAPLLTPVTQDDEQHPDPAPRHRPRAAAPAPPPPASSSDYAQEVFAAGEPDQRSAEACDGGLEREWDMVERERAALERDREMVDRDRAALERERAAVQAERLWLERERAAVERDRAMVEQDRAALDQRALMMNSVGHGGHLNSLM